MSADTSAPSVILLTVVDGESDLTSTDTDRVMRQLLESREERVALLRNLEARRRTDTPTASPGLSAILVAADLVGAHQVRQRNRARMHEDRDIVFYRWFQRVMVGVLLAIIAGVLTGRAEMSDAVSMSYAAIPALGVALGARFYNLRLGSSYKEKDDTALLLYDQLRELA